MSEAESNTSEPSALFEEAPEDVMTLDRIKEIAREAIEAEQLVSDLADALAAAQAAANKIRGGELLRAMTSAGIASLPFEDGTKIEVKDFASGSFPKDDDDNRKPAEEWLKENDGTGMIKTAITLSFDPSKYDTAKELYDELRKRNDATVEFSTSIHAGSYQAFFRERRRSGEEDPPAFMNIFLGKACTITLPGGKKTKRKAK